MDQSKVQLSAEEWQLLQNSGWILTKHAIIDKVYHLFGGLSQRMQLSLPQRGLPPEVLQHSPKISKGEQYERMPWVVLDYPRCFGRENVFAIRTFFWWGHSFSVTIHLKGTYRDRYLPVLQQRWAELAAAGFHVGISEDEWRHEHVPETYRPLVSAEELPITSSFLKLSGACGLDRWGEAHEVLLGLFRVLVDVLTAPH